MNSVLIIFTTLIFVACDNEEKADLGNSGTAPTSRPFLASTDLQPPGRLPTISAEAIGQVINRQSAFFPKSVTQTASSGENCTQQVFRIIKVKATKELLIAEGTSSVSECTTGPAGQTQTYKKAELRAFAQVSCSGKDLSSFNGKSLSDLGQLKSICTNGSFSSSTKLTGDIEFEVGTGLKVSAQIVYKSGLFQENGSACSVTTGASGVEYSACVATEVNEFIGATATGTLPNGVRAADLLPSSYAKFSSEGLKASSEDAAQYSAGKVSFQLNNWKGTTSFSGTAASWQASDGTAQKSGNLTPVN